MTNTRHLTLRLLAPIAVTAALALSGCSQDSAPSVEIMPAEITRSTASVIDGMILADYPGPKAQVHYAGQSQPDFFCNTRDMMYVFLAPEALRKVNAVFVQDMAKADWDNPQGNWIDARKAWYVVGSSRRGSMGATLASFADEAAAVRFSDEWGGEVLPFDRIDVDSVIPPNDGL